MRTHGILLFPVSTPAVGSTIHRPSLLSRVARACPGLICKDDRRIPQYIKRTPMTSADGKYIRTVAKELFSVLFKPF